MYDLEIVKDCTYEKVDPEKNCQYRVVAYVRTVLQPNPSEKSPPLIFTETISSL